MIRAGGVGGKYVIRSFANMGMCFHSYCQTLTLPSYYREAFEDKQQCTYLQLELAAIVDCGEKFVKATYEMEGGTRRKLSDAMKLSVS